MTKLSLFLDGDRPSLEQVLKTREQRALLETAICQKFRNSTLLVLTCNIPGAIKNNAAINQLFEVGKTELLALALNESWNVIYEKNVILPTGPEYFIVFDQEPHKVKLKVVQIEDSSLLGRLWDMDVFYYNQGKTATMSRKDKKKQPRQCLLCQQTAKVCGRNRTHSISELLSEIEKRMLADKRMILK